MPDPIIRLEGISKQFPGVLANDRIDLELYPGEIVALLGENGAGKSTLMSILYGVYQPDAGSIWVDGQPVQFHSPADAIRRGIGMIHQEFMLVPTMTVTDNVMLGYEPVRNGFLNRGEALHELQELAQRYSLKTHPEREIWQLSVGEQQRVEILKVLYRGARVLILDEPTSVLTPQESQDLFTTLKKNLAASGHSIIFITHKMQEVFAIADRVVVLRDGRVISSYASVSDTSVEQLANDMVGRQISFERSITPSNSKDRPLVLELSGVSCQSDRNIPALRGISLQVHAGEMLGIAGVDGNGQQELVEVIAGLRSVTAGKVIFLNKEITHTTTSHRRKLSIAHIPVDRREVGIVSENSVAENLALGAHNRPPISSRGLLHGSQIEKQASHLVQRFDIRCPTIHTETRLLSGGNVQKLILARELSREPALVLAAHPTRGLDIAATKYIHDELVLQRDAGAAILLVSGEIEELIQLCDRIAVMFEGKLMGIVRPREASIESIGLLMAGVDIHQ